MDNLEEQLDRVDTLLGPIVEGTNDLGNLDRLEKQLERIAELTESANTGNDG